MQKASAFIAVFAFCSAAHAQDIGSTQQGLALARSQCSECHRVEGSGRSPDPRAPSFVHIAGTPGMTSPALIAALRTSHRTMPNIIIKDAAIGDLVAYMLSLKE